MPVYAKILKLHRGVDNQIQFQFLNQAQKAVDLTGRSITFRLMNAEGNRIFWSKPLDTVYALNGIMQLNVPHSLLADIVPQRANYSLEITGSPDLELPVFVDPASGARGEIDILDSVLPSFVPSRIITIPTGQLFPNNNSNCCNTVSNTSYTYYSSVLSTKGNPINTVQCEFHTYTGNVTVQASTIPDGEWYTINPVNSYANLSQTEGYVLQGYHPFIRLKFESTQGEVANLLLR